VLTLRKITREIDVLLITDEVMTGWGRVVEWFAVTYGEFNRIF
jgi:taurine--2-oxoglutarate transaminase